MGDITKETMRLIRITSLWRISACTQTHYYSNERRFADLLQSERESRGCCMLMRLTMRLRLFCSACASYFNIPVRGRDADCVCVYIECGLSLGGEGNVHACNCLPHLDIAGGERNKKMRLGYYRWCACNYTIKTTSDLSRQIPYPSLSLTRAAAGNGARELPIAFYLRGFAIELARLRMCVSGCERRWTHMTSMRKFGSKLMYKAILFCDNCGKKSWSLGIFLLTSGKHKWYKFLEVDVWGIINFS